MDRRRTSSLWWAIDRNSCLAAKCFVTLGKWLWHAFLFALAVATFAIVWAVIADLSLIEDDNRRKNLEAKGFINKAADFSKKHKGFKECIAEEWYACTYTKDGKIYREELK